jgi:hypothetical protein
MDSLTDIIKTTLSWYAGGGPNLKIYFLFNDEDQVYSAVAIDTPQREQAAGLVALVRLLGEWVVVEEDHTDRPIYEALMKQGIPRERIILHYAGELLPSNLASA